VAKIQILLVVGTISSNLMVRFAAFGGERCGAVLCWHISTTRITTIPVVKMLHGIGWVGTNTGRLDGQGNGLITTGWWS